MLALDIIDKLQNKCKPTAKVLFVTWDKVHDTPSLLAKINPTKLDYDNSPLVFTLIDGTEDSKGIHTIKELAAFFKKCGVKKDQQIMFEDDRNQLFVLLSEDELEISSNKVIINITL